MYLYLYVHVWKLFVLLSRYFSKEVGVVAAAVVVMEAGMAAAVSCWLWLVWLLFLWEGWHRYCPDGT